MHFFLLLHIGIIREEEKTGMNIKYKSQTFDEIHYTLIDKLNKLEMVLKAVFKLEKFHLTADFIMSYRWVYVSRRADIADIINSFMSTFKIFLPKISSPPLSMLSEPYSV